VGDGEYIKCGRFECSTAKEGRGTGAKTYLGWLYDRVFVACT
jgi:hypothetical protein